ncbi:glycosyltransferase [Massilia sp. GCM10023247]|uniref:glycosyltransferase n=1 Tax=Massilia sp. GCM10023247 TaxID=3252643 RepID=UPI003617CA1F
MNLSGPLRAESAIRSSWAAPDVPMITILCTTYNHEAYIEDAILSFLAQDVAVPFEIIIRDDCSTDATQAIIRKYHALYPNIIQPIIEEKNTFRLGVSPWVVSFPMARGQYLAICEGDDYWTDPNKLQRQYEIMEANPAWSFCCHNAEILYVESGRFTSFNQHRESGTCSTKALLLDDWFVPTASIFFRKEALPPVLPAWFSQVRSQDLALEVILSKRGPFWYDSANASVYRKNAIGSMSATQSTPWDYFYKRIFLFRKLFSWLPYSMSHLVVFDIARSALKIVYAKALRYRRQ